MEPTAVIHPAAEVRDIMTAQVHTLHLDDSLRTAASLFEREHFHHVVVLERGRVQGVVSDRDILKAVSPFVGNPMLERPQDASTLKKRVHQIMTRKPVTIEGDQSIAVAADVMLTQRVSCLPVVDDDGKLLGIVTVRDLLAQLAAPHFAS
ncbi:MAG: CBS domain-containing protein [Planctomycetota bacterium]